MKETLSNKQIMLILTIAVLPHDAMEIGKKVGEVTGTGGWITILIEISISLLLVYMMTYVGCVFSGETIDDYSSIIFGKVFSYIIIGIYIICYFLIIAMLAPISCHYIQLNLLEKTPVSAMVILMFIVAYYTVCKGLRVIGRLTEIYGIIILLLIVFIHVIMLTQSDPINLRPFLGIVKPIEHIKALPKLVPYVGFELLWIIPLQKSNVKITKYTVSAVLISGIAFLLIFESCIAMLGIDDIVHYKDPLFVAVRRLDVQYLEFLRRFDGIFIIAWLMSIFLKICMYLYSVTYLLNKIFTKAKFEVLAFCVVVSAYSVALLPKSFESKEQFFRYSGKLSIFSGVIMPLLLFIIVKVKKYDKKIY